MASFGTLIFGLCFLRLVTSQRQNLASQQGLQAYQTRLPESQRRRAEIVRKKLPTIKPKHWNLWRGDTNFLYLPVFHDQDTVTVEDCVEPVGNGQHSAIFEGIFDGVLNKSVSLRVHGGSGFIQENDLLGKERCESHTKPKLYLEGNLQS